MNSRAKGARGERQWRDELRANGYEARRGQQFSGSPDSPDVLCDSLPWIHFEVKAVEHLNIHDAMDQARRDAGVLQVGRARRSQPSSAKQLDDSQHSTLNPQLPKVPILAHRRNFRRWLVTLEAETFFQFLRGTLPPESTGAERQELSKTTTTEAQAKYESDS